MTPDTSVTERVAGHFFRARVSLPQAQTNAFWERSLEHHREMVAKYPEYAHARSLVHDCFRDAEIALAAISSMPALEEENARLREALTKVRAISAKPTYPGNNLRDIDDITRAALSPRKEDQPDAFAGAGKPIASLTRKDGSEGVERAEAEVVQAVVEQYCLGRMTPRPIATNIYTKPEVKEAFAKLAALKEGASREG